MPQRRSVTSTSPRAPAVLRAPIPPTRDPFINTPLLRLPPGPDGLERFWISTCNFNVGCLGALVTEEGEARIYRLKLPHACFYSAAAEDEDTLWLCGWTSYVARLTLSTGELEAFETGAPGALNFQGMVLDHESGKIFAAAFHPPKTIGFSFDFRRRLPVKVQELPTRGHYARFSFPNGDGTWSVVLALPGHHVVIWDPRTEAVEEVTVAAKMMPEDQTATTHALLGDESGRRYFPRTGWYDPRSRRIEEASRPQREMTWFGRHAHEAVGVSTEHALATLGAWDLTSTWGEVREVCRVPDGFPTSFNLTAAGKIVAVNVYGVFFRFDAATGALECSKVLDAESIGWDNCLCRLDRRRVLGTPYITQRFWQVDVRTGRGSDLAASPQARVRR